MNLHRKLLAPLLATLLLAACGGGLNGTYVDYAGNPHIKLSSGKAYIGVDGTREMDYSVNDDKIILQRSEGNLVLTRNPDGSLDTPWGTLRKKSGDRVAGGGGPEGTYRIPGARGSMTFSSGTAKFVSSDGNTSMRMHYTVSGNKIVVRGPDGHTFVTFTRQSDGSLETPDGKALRKE